jgi:3-hydroxyisobutyrate dehydrogenase
MKKVGFIGLGLMGNGMSMNILKGGFPLTVWNRTRSRMNELIDAGAMKANSPKEVAENSEIIVMIVTDSSDVKEVIMGKEGVINGVKSGSIVIDMSTISPLVTKEITEELEKKEAHMLDAPVSGGVIGAKEGTLSIMVGGEKKVFDEALPVLETMGKTITHVGKNGDGQIVKAVNQILVGMTMLGVAEGLMFASKAGVDLQKCYQAVSGGAAGSWQLTVNGNKILHGDLEPGFKIKDYVKDLRIIMETASELKMPLLGTKTVQQLFWNLNTEEMKNKGTQAIIVPIEKLAGKKLLE